MATSKKAPSKNSNAGGMNEYSEREHQEKIAREKERLKDPSLNEYNKQEIREKIAREEGKR